MLTIVLQAGGKSTRMGTDKALLPFLGNPLIERLKTGFSDLADELLVITNNPDAYQSLGIPIHIDIIPERGALGGLYTALAVASFPAVGVIAADLPFASRDLLQDLFNKLQDSAAAAVIPSSEHGMEPLHAGYNREICLPLVLNAIEQDLWKMSSWHDQADILVLSPEETRKATKSEYTFWNLNTPDDLKQAEITAQNFDLI